jgi:YD repeat-containing protein
MQVNFNIDGNLVAKGYSGAGNVSYQYDQNRRLTRKVLQAPGSTETSLFAYDAANQLTSRQADLGEHGVHHHDHSYDSIGRQVRYRTNPGMELFYTWDLEGKRTSTTVPETGYAVHTEYDVNHRPIRQVDNEGDVWLFEYDAANRRTAVIYPDGSGNFTAYDMAGQVVEEWAVTPLGAYLFHERHTFRAMASNRRTCSWRTRLRSPWPMGSRASRCSGMACGSLTTAGWMDGRGGLGVWTRWWRLRLCSWHIKMRTTQQGTLTRLVSHVGRVRRNVLFRTHGHSIPDVQSVSALLVPVMISATILVGYFRDFAIASFL